MLVMGVRGTRGSGIVSIANDVLEMRLEWVRGLGFELYQSCGV